MAYDNRRRYNVLAFSHAHLFLALLPHLYRFQWNVQTSILTLKKVSLF